MTWVPADPGEVAYDAPAASLLALTNAFGTANGGGPPCKLNISKWSVTLKKLRITVLSHYKLR